MVTMERTHQGRDWLVLVGFGVAAFAAAAIGGLGISGTGQEYASLERPSWAPPSWLFGPVWTVLYAMIALAGWLAWRRVGWSWPLVPYAVQLVLNAAWTPIFFGFGAYGLATVDIIAMWLAIGATVVVFWRVRRVAALLLLPYWAWVTYATALTIAIWRLN